MRRFGQLLLICGTITLLLFVRLQADTYQRHISFAGGYRFLASWQPYSEQIDFGTSFSDINSVSLRVVGGVNPGSRHVAYYQYDPVLGYVDHSYWTSLPSALVGSLDGLNGEWLYDTGERIDLTWTFTKLTDPTTLTTLFDGKAALNLGLDLRPDELYLDVMWPSGDLTDVYVTLDGTPSVPEPTSLAGILVIVSSLAACECNRRFRRYRADMRPS